MSDTPKTVRVRIPCLVDSKGQVCAYLRTDGSRDSEEAMVAEMREWWVGESGEHVVWITAEVPLPQPVEIDGKVEHGEA